MAEDEIILLGLGANLEHPRYGGPVATLSAALEALEGQGVAVARRSRWYQSPPVPASDQPWFVNAVAVLDTLAEPAALLALLHAVEADFGRHRTVRNAPRAIDLDLLAYGERVSGPEAVPALPHPRMTERAFVLRPLAEVAPGWRHPGTGAGLEALIAALPGDHDAWPMD